MLSSFHSQRSSLESVTRFPGADYLRILAMLGVVLLHLLQCGAGALSAQHSGDGLGIFLAHTMMIGVWNSVNVFAMLSGYLCCMKGSYSSGRCLHLIASILFYYVFIIVLFRVCWPDVYVGCSAEKKTLYYFLNRPYWYVISYVPVFFLMPYVNAFLNSLSTSQLRRVFWVVVGLFSVISTGLLEDPFALREGYSFVWLLILYVLGGCLRKCGLSLPPLKGLLCFFAILVAIGVYATISLCMYDRIRGFSFIFNYTSPIMVALSLLLFLSLIKCRGGCSESGIVRFLSAYSLDVYLIHCHFLIYHEVIGHCFLHVFQHWPVLVAVALILSTACSIYMIAAVVGYGRAKLFSLLGLDWLLRKLAGYVDRAWLPAEWRKKP